jgi:hypothetical protein
VLRRSLAPSQLTIYNLQSTCTIRQEVLSCCWEGSRAALHPCALLLILERRLLIRSIPFCRCHPATQPRHTAFYPSKHRQTSKYGETGTSYKGDSLRAKEIRVSHFLFSTLLAFIPSWLNLCIYCSERREAAQSSLYGVSLTLQTFFPSL